MSSRQFAALSLCLLTACLIGPAVAHADTPVNMSGYATYSHPLGLSFQYPQSWKVSEGLLGLQVEPPDAGSSWYGPTEAYFFSIIGTDPSVTSLDDPKAAQLLDGEVTGLLPFLRRTDGAKKVGENGRVWSWNGTSPEGLNVDCHVFGKVEMGYFVSLNALGDAEAVTRRQTEVVNIFQSITVGPPTPNPQHASTWYSSSYTSSSASSYGNRVNTATHHTMTLLPDGRLTTSAQTAVHGWSQDGPGGTDRTSITGLTDESVEEGRWAVVGSDLYVLWKDVGVVKWSVYIQGEPGRREMFLTPAGDGEGVLWTEYPD